MIDENSHHSQHQPKSVRKRYVFSWKTCTHRLSFCLSLSCPRPRPQELSPSTFLFLHSSQCQRADLQTLAGQTSLEQSLRIHSGNRTPRPVARQIVRPVRKTSTVGARSSTSSTWLDVIDTPKSVNTQFQVSTKPKLKTGKPGSLQTSHPLHHQFLSNFRSLPVAAALAAPRSPAMSRVIGAPTQPVNPEK
jgi:hypothetical protein